MPTEKDHTADNPRRIASARQSVHLFTGQLKPGDKLNQFFQVQTVEMRKTRTGNDYLDMVVRDATGAIAARLWAETIRRYGADFSAGDVVKIDGHVETYRDRNQIIVEKIRKAAPEELEQVAALQPRSQDNPELLFEELVGYARGLRPPSLSDLVVALLLKHEKAIKTCPAAKMVHHAYEGGLVEHLVGVTGKAACLAEKDASINRDLAIAGAILHDIGKIQELKLSGQARTIEGRLVGHVILGFEMVARMGYEKQCTGEPWFLELQHIILSHHGQADFGAPVRPATREAILIHYIDMLDSRLKILEQALESKDADGFSAYNKWLEGRGYAGYHPSGKED
ncbi:MAG: 3'-5' exoribonuclease YhaM family protein [Desulfomonilaceae bacterium]